MMLVNLSGRGDKDVHTVEKTLARTPRGRVECGSVRIATRFEALRRESRTGLVTYITAGDPNLPLSAEILRALDRAGADVIEVGVPFSDPLADGPVIQRATERALAAGSSLRESLALVERTRGSIAAPVVMFSYANPLLRMGLEAFARRAAGAGVDGVLALDLPIEEAGEFRETLASPGLDTIFLLSPTTTDARIRTAAALGRGFLYGISRLGVTGARDRVASGAEALVRRIRDAHVAADCARLRHLASGTRRGSRRVCGRGRRRQRARVAHRGARSSPGLVGRVEDYVRELKGAATVEAVT